MSTENVLRAWNLGDATCERIAVGNINQTYSVRTDDERWALQRLNTDIFTAEVHHDIDAVTGHLNAIDREQLLQALEPSSVLSVVGGRSRQTMLDYHQQLQQRFTNWQHQVMSGCDHSLVYQKPKQAAALIEQFLKDSTI